MVSDVCRSSTARASVTLTGTLDTYFGDRTIYNDIINNTLTSFDMRVGRQDGNRESILFVMFPCLG